MSASSQQPTMKEEEEELQIQHEKIIVIDFGSQYTQLIARRIRELNVYSEIYPFSHFPEELLLDDAKRAEIRGFILSGSPCSVTEKDHPSFPHLQSIIHKYKLPILCICYGAQLLAHEHGGEIVKSKHREYGRAKLILCDLDNELFQNVDDKIVWMSHGDAITKLSEDNQFVVIAKTDSVPVVAYRLKDKPVYGLQFHPEVHHTECGTKLFENFLVNICKCCQMWTPAHFVSETVRILKHHIQTEHNVVMAISGGVDSTVAATLLQKAIGDRLHCIFVDNGMLRKNEFAQVLETYKEIGLNVKGVDAKEIFYQKLKGVVDPEQKRKIIGSTFIDIFDVEAHKIQNVKYLGQGTIYPDVIESVSVKGPAVTIKSHHNVGGLPAKMKLKVVEPLRLLFKDEVRKVGIELGIPNAVIHRHPFPGPGLSIRILSDVTPEKISILQEVDHIFITSLKEAGLYDQVWQGGAILLPVQSVGVMGDERTYENVVALRAVTSVDGMTADWCHLPYEFLGLVSNRIINQVKGVNRVVYDISSKPPATIEWE